MDGGTIGGLLVGGFVTGAVAYIFRLFGKRSDKLDEIEKRQIEHDKAFTEMTHLKGLVEELRVEMKEIRNMLVELRIQSYSTNSRKRRTQSDAE